MYAHIHVIYFIIIVNINLRGIISLSIVLDVCIITLFDCFFFIFYFFHFDDVICQLCTCPPFH